MIEFVNIKSGERVKLTRPHQIGAYLNSSDLSPNSNAGQDFGWRLAPSVVVRLDEMRSDLEKLESISKRTGVPLDELTTIHLVQQISYEEAMKEAQSKIKGEREPAYKQSYEEEIKALKSGGEVPAVKPVSIAEEEPVATADKPEAKPKK